MYLVKDGGVGTSSLTFALDSTRVLSQGRFFYRSTLTDSAGYFFFTDLPDDSSYTIRPHMETYSFDPPERSMATGAVTTLFNVAAEENVAPACSAQNLGAVVTAADRKALSLQTFVLNAIDKASIEISSKVKNDTLKQKIEDALGVAQAGTNFAYFEVMNESFALPKIVVQCSTIPPNCVPQSYRATISKYRLHLLTLRRAGLYANRVSSRAMSSRSSSRNEVAKKIRQLHRAALRATKHLPRASVECP